MTTNFARGFLNNPGGSQEDIIFFLSLNNALEMLFKDIESMWRTLEELEFIEEELQSRDPKYGLTAGVWRGKLARYSPD